MATKLTSRQQNALNTLPAHAALLRPLICGNSPVNWIAYDSDGNVLPGATAHSEMTQAMFTALHKKGALEQINDADRPWVCLGYRVAA